MKNCKTERLKKMTVKEWNEFAQKCDWAIVEPVIESEADRAEMLALVNEMFGDETPSKM